MTPHSTGPRKPSLDFYDNLGGKNPINVKRK